MAQKLSDMWRSTIDFGAAQPNSLRHRNLAVTTVLEKLKKWEVIQPKFKNKPELPDSSQISPHKVSQSRLINKVYHSLMNNNRGRRGRLIYFLPLKRRGLFERVAYIIGDLRYYFSSKRCGAPLPIHSTGFFFSRTSGTTRQDKTRQCFIWSLIQS